MAIVLRVMKAAGWITSFIRTTISEIMNHIDRNGGSIISCNTDGFLNNMKDLEYLQIEGNLGEFSRIFTLARERLGAKTQLLEIKFTERTGIISWSTRGGIGSKLRAMTGYQVTQSHDVLVIREIMKVMEGDKTLPFVQFSLPTCLTLAHLRRFYEVGCAMPPHLHIILLYILSGPLRS